MTGDAWFQTRRDLRVSWLKVLSVTHRSTPNSTPVHTFWQFCTRSSAEVVWKSCRLLYTEVTLNFCVSARHQKALVVSGWDVNGCNKTSISDTLRRAGAVLPLEQHFVVAFLKSSLEITCFLPPPSHEAFIQTRRACQIVGFRESQELLEQNIQMSGWCGGFRMFLYKRLVKAALSDSFALSLWAWIHIWGENREWGE